MRQLSLTKKFSLLLLLALPLFAFVLGKVITSAMHQSMLNRSNEIAANFLTYEITNKLNLEDFDSPAKGEVYQQLTRQIESLNLGPDVMNVKVWNRDFTTTWSSNEDETGKKSPEHHELLEVYEGELVSEISTGHHLNEKYAHASSANEVMELYIPVRPDPGREVSLVFEVYRNIDPLLAEISHHNRIIWVSIVLGMGFLYVVLFGLVWGASRQIDEQDREIKVSMEQIANAKKEWEETFDTINDAITIHDRDFNIIRTNRAAEDMLGVSMEQIIRQKCFRSYHGSDSPPAKCPSCKTAETGVESTTEIFEPHLDKYLEIKALPRLDDDRKLMGVVHVVRDITDRKKAEEKQEKLQAQLIQMQKMETVGRLAGGIAHDFNNILSAIIGYSELVMRDLPEDSNTYKDIETIKKSGEKAAVLTGQLLAFSRKQVLKMQPVDLNSIIEGMSKMLYRLIGENIQLDLHLTPKVGIISADPGQLEQIILNLAVNASDAMPEGGSLVIETSEVDLEEEHIDKHLDAKPGRHVLLAVSDTGAGMTDDVKQQIFEPFFTTKERGKGTGLGLSTVYGIVKQHESQIYVYSEPGRGTTFKVFFPVSSEMAHVNQLDSVRTRIPMGKETILLAEDDRTISRMIKNYLEPLGYNLLLAGNGEEALAISRSHKGDIQLLLTDVIMPKMNGQELAAAIQEQRPELQVIFMSGYTDDVIVRHGVLDPDVNFIQKPITPSKLAQVLNEVLKKT